MLDYPPLPSPFSLRHRIYTYLLACPFGATDEQMQRDLSLGSQTQTPRRGELVKLGLVEDSGQTGLTQRGRTARLWQAVRRATPDARRA